MRAKSFDSGLAFSSGNGSLAVSSSGQFHHTKLAETESQKVIIIMRTSLPHVLYKAVLYITGERCHVQINAVDLMPKNRCFNKCMMVRVTSYS